MAKIERSRGGRFKVNNPNLQAGLKQEQIQQQRIIDSLTLQQKQSDKRDADQIRFMEKSDINESQNRKIIQDLENKKFENRYNAVSKRAQTEVDNLRGQAKEYQKESEFWQKFTPKLAKDLTTAAEGIYNFADMRYAEKEFASMIENNEFDLLKGFYNEQNKLVDNGIVDDMYDALSTGDVDRFDFLGNTRRKNSYFLGKMVTDKIKSDYELYVQQKLEIVHNPQLNGGRDFSEFLAPDKVRSTYKFWGVEQVKQLGLNPKSPAGLEIIKLWDDRGRSEEQKARLQISHYTSSDNADQAEQLFFADPTRDNLNNLNLSIGRIPSKDRKGNIARGIKSFNVRANHEVLIQRLASNKRYAGNGGFEKFVREVLEQRTPGKDSKQTWLERHPALYDFAYEEYYKGQKTRLDKEKEVSEINDVNEVTQITLDIENGNISLSDFSEGGDRQKLEARTRTASGTVSSHIHDLLGYNPKIMDSFGQSEILNKAHRDGDFTGFMFTYRTLTDTQRREFDVFRKDLTDLQEAYGGDYIKDVRKKADEIIAHATGEKTISDRKHPTAFAAVDALEQSYYYHFNRLRGEEDPLKRRDLAWEAAEQPVTERTGMFRTQTAAEGKAGSGQEKTIWLQFSNENENSGGLSFGAIEAELIYNKKTPNDLISAGTIVDRKSLGRFALAINSGADTLIYPQSVRDLSQLTGIPKRDVMNRVLEVNKYEQRIPADYSSVVTVNPYIKPRHHFANLAKDFFGEDIPVSKFTNAFRENLTGIDAIRFNYDESEGEMTMGTMITEGRQYGIFYDPRLNTFIQR